MKIRTAHVTNSSSASFIIPKSKLSDLQISMIKCHIEISNLLASEGELDYKESYLDQWRITEDNENIYGDTMMDNFDMQWFLKNVGVDENDIEWDHS
jgi:hypothetical protein